MDIKLVLVVVCMFIISIEVVCASKGVIHISPYDEETRKGLRIVYRPEDFISSDIPLKQHYIRFKIGYNKSGASSVSSPLHLLHWDAQGKYFFYEQSIGQVFPRNVIGYSIRTAFYGYIDYDKFYYVPSVMKYCALDRDFASDEYRCSNALAQLTNGNSFLETTKAEETSIQNRETTMKTKGPLNFSVAGIALPVLLGCFVIMLIAIGLSLKFCKKKPPHRQQEVDAPSQARERSSTERASSSPGIFAVISERINRTMANNDAPPSYQAAIEVERYDNKAYSSHSITIGEEEAASKMEHTKTEEESELPPLYEQLCLDCCVAKDSPMCIHNSNSTSPPNSSNLRQITYF